MQLRHSIPSLGSPSWELSLRMFIEALHPQHGEGDATTKHCLEVKEVKTTPSSHSREMPNYPALHGTSADVFGGVYSPSQGPLPCFLGVIRSLATDSQSTFLTHDSSCKNKNTVTHQACRMCWPISGWAVQPCQTAQCHIPAPKTWSSLSSLSPPLPLESQNSISCMSSWVSGKLSVASVTCTQKSPKIHTFLPFTPLPEWEWPDLHCQHRPPSWQFQ